LLNWRLLYRLLGEPLLLRQRLLLSSCLRQRRPGELLLHHAGGRCPVTRRYSSCLRIARRLRRGRKRGRELLRRLMLLGDRLLRR
jgi:hypothetical protein